MALICLLCLLVVPLLAQGARPSSRKLLWTVPEKPSHGGSGSHAGGDGTTAIPEPCSGDRESGSRGSEGTGEARCDTAKWAEIHTDYIYTQDVKNP
ncbi:unnamed protein product [Urochloa humidicola]